MADTSKTAGNGIGFGGLLFLIFLVLKLAKIGSVADWSWWWVTSPLWIPFGVATLIFIVVVIKILLHD